MKGDKFEAFVSQFIRLYRSMDDEKTYNQMLAYAEKHCTDAQWAMLQQSVQRVQLEMKNRRLDATDKMEVIRD